MICCESSSLGLMDLPPVFPALLERLQRALAFPACADLGGDLGGLTAAFRLGSSGPPGASGSGGCGTSSGLGFPFSSSDVSAAPAWLRSGCCSVAASGVAMAPRTPPP